MVFEVLEHDGENNRGGLYLLWSYPLVCLGEKRIQKGILPI